MLRNNLILLLLLLSFNFAKAQEIFQFGSTAKNEEGTAVLNLPSNAGYLLVTTEALLKIKPDGSQEWATSLNGSFKSICKADPGFCFLAGTDSSKKATVLKVNTQTGTIAKTYSDTLPNAQFEAILPNPNGGLIACGHSINPNDPLETSIPLIITFDKDLAAATQSALPDNVIGAKLRAMAAKGNDIFIGGTGQNSVFFFKLGDSTATVMQNGEPTVSFLTIANDNTLFLGVQATQNFTDYASTIYHLSNSGSLVSSESFPFLNAAIFTDSSLVCTGTENNKLILMSLDYNLKVNWSKSIGNAPINIGTAIDTTQNGFIVAGLTGTDSNLDACLVRSVKKPTFLRQIQGKLEAVKTCGATGIPLANFLIKGKTIANGRVHTAITDNTGHYTMTVDTTGLIELEAAEIAGSGYKSCPIKIDTVLDNGIIKTIPTLTTQDTSTQSTLKVDIAAGNNLVPGGDVVYTAYVKNLRSIPVSAASVKVHFANSLIRKAESEFSTLLPDSSLLFSLGPIEANAVKTFTITRKLNIGSITPNKSYCASIESLNAINWNGPRILVTGVCMGTDSARFTVKNISTGTGNSAALINKAGVVIITDVILKTILIDTLKAGETKIFTVKDTSLMAKTYAFFLDQGIDNPYGSIASARVEGCGVGTNYLPQNTYSDFDSRVHSVQCLEAQTAPPAKNETTIQPIGLENSLKKEHRIIQNQQIALEPLHVIVNNSDSIKTGVMLEVLMSDSLKLLNFVPGAASHKYRLEIENKTLKVFFDDLALKPSERTFFTYRIKVPFVDTSRTSSQRFTTETSVRFGYNAPKTFVDTTTRIITKKSLQNTTSIQLVPVSSQSIANISFAPNPFEGTTTMTIEESLVGSTLTVFDVLGRLAKKVTITQSVFQLDSEGLDKGLYLCVLTHKGKLIARGKVVIQ